MEIKKDAICGTLESNDLLVKIAPRQGLDVVISSEVMRQFGARIREVVEETLQKMDVTNAQVVIEDRGALDCTIRARVQAAVMRANETAELDWRAL
jgi:citrate lyase subunit gamma (acyl carrier protein)